MYVITGAAGFIGSCLVSRLNAAGMEDMVLVDDFSSVEKQANLAGKKFRQLVHRDDFFNWAEKETPPVTLVFHLGARTDTTEFDEAIFQKLNLGYSQKVWEYCTRQAIPLVYASSAATYGNGELGYTDSHDIVPKLHPLNPYGVSKNEFDKWALRQEQHPPRWQGLKFFNVYGPNEYHKGRMASVVYHAFRQIRRTGQMKLFRSHNENYADGKQLRDFIYVKDIVDICLFFGNQPAENGLYNAGTGRARTFLDLANAVFHTLGKTPEIGFIDIPEDIRDKYQYFTEADTKKLRNAGFTQPMTSLEEGIQEYVSRYLQNNIHQ
jgi:ADP-L-glycero-D-manno-heptose 6-epimerase